MHVIRRGGWELPESHATPEHLFISRGAGRIRPLPADGDVPRFEDGVGTASELVALALYRGPDHGGGDQRARLSGDRRLRQADSQATWFSIAPGGAVEIRLQVDQVDR